MSTSKSKKPALLLFFLSPAIAELLSGSAPPAEFFNPIGFLFIVSLYGSGCLIMRELRVRWRKSVCTLLLLGAAYGVQWMSSLISDILFGTHHLKAHPLSGQPRGPTSEFINYISSSLPS